ncbi:MAG: hypothetical protein AAFV80_00315, partial [Bacteroidota bacterium]
MRTRFMLLCMFALGFCNFAVADTFSKDASSQYESTVMQLQKSWNAWANAGVSATQIEVVDLEKGQLTKAYQAGKSYQVNVTNWLASAGKNQFQVAAIDANGQAVGSWQQDTQKAGWVDFSTAVAEANTASFVWTAPASVQGNVELLFVSNQSQLNSIQMAEQFFAGAPINTFPYTETFNGASFCNNVTFSCPDDCAAQTPADWVQGTNGVDDADDFRIINAGTPSGGTGPDNGNGDAGFYLYCEASGCATNSSTIFSPQFDLTGLGTPIFRYHTYLYGGDLDATSGIFVEISNDGGMTYVPLDAQTGPQVQTGIGEEWTRTDVDLSAYLNQTVQFRVTGTTGTDFEGDVAFDDVFVGNMPTCIEPSAFTILGVGINSVDLDWTPSGTESSWTIEVGAPGFMPGTGAEVASANPTGNPAAVGGLMAATDYEAYIKSNCGFTEESVWVGPVSFLTACDVFNAPYVETFDNGGSIPVCWTNNGLENWLFNNVGTGHINNVGNFLDGTDFVDVTQGDGANGYFAWVDDSAPHNVGTELISPFINTGALTNPGVIFWYASNNEGETNVDFSVDVWDGTAWNDDMFTSNTNTVDWEQVFIDLSPLTITGPIQVRFVVDENNGTDFDDDLAIDQMSVENLPSCLPPTGVTAANVSDMGVDISWTAEPSATSYVIEWGVAPLTPGSGMTQIASTTMGSITGLMADTEYDVFVYSDCAGDPSGPTIAPTSFTTLCAVFTTPYFENFDDGGVLDNCWTLQGAEPWNVDAQAPAFGHVNDNDSFICGDPFTDNTVGDGATGYFVWVDDSAPASTDTWLISPLVDMTGVASPTLTFYYASNNEGFTNVDFSVDLWDGSQWIEDVFFSNTNTADWDYAVVDLSANLPFSGPIQVRFDIDENNGGDFY